MSKSKKPAKEPNLEPPSIGLDRKVLDKTVATLEVILGNQHVLYVKTRNFHWNLVGPRFHSLHEFFEELYTALEADIDLTAERIRMAGGVAPGSMKELLKLATLKEHPREIIHGENAIKALLMDHEEVVRGLREAVGTLVKSGDAGNEDFVISLLQAHEKAVWMLRSYTER